VFSRPATDLAAWDRLVADFADPAPAPLAIAPAEATPAPRPDDEIDVAGFLAGWDALTDTHHFFPLLTKFGLTRTQAFRLAGAERARPVPPASLRRALTAAAASGTPIMVFVGNPGCIQIHTGPVVQLREAGPWFNVLDPGFNLHVREPAIDRAWVVRKPTDDGVVTSLELFDARGEAIATLFGKRKPGQAEDPAWRAICAGLADA
jgi:putative hemin transport protein